MAGNIVESALVPKDALVSEIKVRDYLLSPREKGDKSRFLERAGYTKNGYNILLRNIQEQLLPATAVFQESTPYGDKFRSVGNLTGPNGTTLHVTCIWQRNDEGGWRFITLYPGRRPSRQ
jgi:hypothetical protein